jgi:hypothetical protein
VIPRAWVAVTRDNDKKWDDLQSRFGGRLGTDALRFSTR